MRKPKTMQVFTTGEVSRICKVAPSTVSKWFDTGQLRGYRVPGSQHRRIPRQSLMQFLKDNGMPLGELERAAQARVLIVSKDVSLQDSLERELTKTEGVQVEVAESGFSAGIEADAFRPDCVLVDFSLGTVQATNVCRNLRRSPQFSSVVTVAILPSEQTAAEVDEGLFDESFVRPFDPALLVQRLARQLSR